MGVPLRRELRPRAHWRRGSVWVDRRITAPLTLRGAVPGHGVSPRTPASDCLPAAHTPRIQRLVQGRVPTLAMVAGRA